MRKALVLSTATALFAGVAYGGGADFLETEPNDTAGTADNAGVLTNGFLISANHVTAAGVMTDDWFTFTLPDFGGNWTIETLPDYDGLGDGIADTRLFLYSDAGTTLITTNDDGGLADPDTGFGLSILTDVAPGTYWLENSGFLDDDAGTGVDYFISFTTIPAPGAMALLGLAGVAGARRRRR